MSLNEKNHYICANTVNTRVTSSGCRCTLLLSNTVVGQLQGFILSFYQRTDNNRAAVLCPIRREKWKCDGRKDRKGTRSHDKSLQSKHRKNAGNLSKKTPSSFKEITQTRGYDPSNNRRSNIIRNYQNRVKRVRIFAQYQWWYSLLLTAS